MKRIDTMKLILATGILGSILSGPALAQMAIPENEPARPVADERTEPVVNEPEEMISFGIFSEPIELTTLIDFVGDQLGVNIVIKGSPAGDVVFNAPVEVRKSKLIDLLDAMLDQYNFTVTYESASGFYIVQPAADIKPVFGDELATTKIIETPNIKPSLLVAPLLATLNGPGSAATSNQGGSTAIQAIDELGVLIINARSRDIRRIEDMVNALIEIDRDQEYIRFKLDHIAAPTALNRIVGLVGGGSSTTSARVTQGGNNRGNNQNINNLLGGSGATLSDIADRISVDPQGNALIFRGSDNEIARVRELLDLIDVPNPLEPRNYFGGASAAQIADIAKQQGLGEVVQIEDTSNQLSNINQFGGNNPLTFGSDDNDTIGGSFMVVDPTRGSIIYYGTQDQHAQLDKLLKELKTDDERVEIRNYKLDHTDALTVTDLLNAIIKGESQTGDSALLSGAAGRNNRNFTTGLQIFGDGESGSFDPDKITITADEPNNQVIINAPIKQQEDIELLIGRLDQQRTQVYIEAMIISVSDDEDFLLAFETQLNRGDFGLGTNFGLSSRDNFTDPKAVSSALSGLTTALINSDAVPLIINATQTNTDARILSTPQLLVNNNEESTIASVSEQPYNEISQGNNGGQNIETFGGFEEAGTTLTVTPSISNAGFIRLLYEIEFSNFTASQGINGSPPPRDRNTLTGSATIPSNGTIVLGGITVDDVRDTVLKVPLIGDIPLVGELFRRTNKVNNRSKLYVFLTPRIMSDPHFNDLKLFSQGPQADMELESNDLDMEPAIIDAGNAATNNSQLPERREENNAVAPAMESQAVEVTEVSGS